MKKAIAIIILVALLFLTACMEPSMDRLSITLNPSVDTIEINSNYQDPGATASYGFVNVATRVKSSNLDIHTLGVYEIVYIVSYNGLEKEITRMVTVVDQTPPVITLNPGVDTLFVGQEWQDAHVTATDNSGVLPTISVNGTVDHLVPGIYIITYTAQDESGNESSISRYVEVIDPASLNIN